MTTAKLLLHVFALACGMVVAGAAQPAPLAEYLRYQTDDRVTLNALLWSPSAASRSIVILVPGFYGSFSGGHDYVPMAERLNAKGYAFMVINMRTASDFTDPYLEDCIKDVGAAVRTAKERGFTDVALFGTSLGGPRSIIYLTSTQEPAIRAYGLIASIMSPYEEAQLRMDEAHKAKLEDRLATARALVAQSRDTEMIVYEDWFPGRAVRMTARGFLNVFGAPSDTRISTPSYGSKVVVPTAVFHGTKDEISLPPNAQAIYASLTAAPSRELIWVEGATHYLQPGRIAEDYAEQVSNWVAKTMPAAR